MSKEVTTYILYEKMILNKIAPTIELHLIKEQNGFRPGKSCTSQLLNFTQHIEDGYQESMITVTVFVDLAAAYDTVNHRRLIQKLYNITKYSTLCRVIQNLLSNRRFYVELNTNDQPVHDGTRSFIYAVPYLLTSREHY